MNFDERLAKTQAKLEELKAKVNESLDIKTADRAAKREDALDKINAFVSDPDAVNKVFDKVDEKLAVMIDDGIDAADKAIHGIDQKVDDAIETTEGDYYAAKEDLRIAQENVESSLSSRRLEIQMRLEAAKNEISTKRTSIDKSIQEELIADLLDYADDCQAIAYSYAVEAELAILDACDMIDDYEAKYGKME